MSYYLAKDGTFGDCRDVQYAFNAVDTAAELVCEVQGKGICNEEMFIM